MFCLIQAHYLFKKSQQGGGSSIEALRPVGFCCSDGVRMNNLIFRAGHLQNVITVDESLLDNVGILWSCSHYLVVMHLVVPRQQKKQSF
jgi:hypothetical protein